MNNNRLIVSLGLLGLQWSKLLKWFIPHEILNSTDIEARRKHFLFTNICWVTIISNAGNICISWLLGLNITLLMLVVIWTVFIMVILFLLRLSIPLTLCTNGYILSLLIVFSYLMSRTGGVHSALSWTLSLSPLLAILLLDISKAKVYLLLSLCVIFAISMMPILGFQILPAYGSNLAEIINPIAFCAFCPIIITAFTLVFESGRVRAHNDLELEKASVQRKVDEAVLTIQEQEKQARLKDVKMAGLQHEIQMAADLQMGMLPKNLPNLPGYDISVLLRMTREAGGDLYDVIKINDCEYLLAIGDVSGKGMPAALYMSAALNVLRTEIACFTDESSSSTQAKLSPAKLLKIINALMKDTMRSGSFVTLFLGILNIETNELRFSSSGHDPCIRWNPITFQWDMLNTEGQACGAVGARVYNRFVEEKTVLIEPGDYLMWNTDGITEAKNPVDKEYTDERYWKRMQKLSGSETCEEAIVHIIQDVEAFAGTAEQYDDMTLLCLKRL